MTLKYVRTPPMNIDAEGFRARLAGFEVRDCFLILEPDRNVSLALLARRESKGSLLDTVIRTGQGVLDIDGSRVPIHLDNEPDVGNVYYERRGLPYPDRKERGRIFRPGAVEGETMSSDGRFPANLILKHTFSCIQAPTPQCAEGCPVQEIDIQGVAMGSHSAGSKRDYYVPESTQDDTRISWGVEGYTGKRHGDKGGVSRFFKQVQSEDELGEYLDALLRVKTE
jgi:hypothetical protein